MIIKPTTVVKLLLRYLIFAGIPFFVAKKIEKRFWSNADEDLKKKIGKKFIEQDEIDKLSNSSKDKLNNRGGAIDPLTVWLIKIVMADLALKTGVAGMVLSTIWSESADNAAAHIIYYSKAIVMAPGTKLRSIVRKLQRIDPTQTRDIREILLDKDLGKQEKWELLRLKIEYALKNLRGRKRRQFILLVIAAITFAVGTQFYQFTWFMSQFRDLLGRKDDLDTVKEYLIELYQEYNAPLPKELIPDDFITKIMK